MNQSPDKSYYYKQTFSIITKPQALEKKEFEECVFKKINMVESIIRKSKFASCRFEDCSLSAVKPIECVFTETEFKNCKVTGFDWTSTKYLYLPSFINCHISFSSFRFLKLPKMRLLNCLAKETDFTECDLSEGEFKDTDFEGSRFFKTNLSRTDFRQAKNYSIDIKTNIIKKAKFSYPEVMGLLRGLEISVEF